jgi:hypothetical protein
MACLHLAGAMWVRVAVVVLLLLLPTSVFAQEKRIALLIGNKRFSH